ncbi:uncharacterized protein [Oryza sativa Japonica Group]|jgi:hypothetical protein|uniref:uncharacterized protein n=1 Tax=Oryza sativa subsp. japonica TaxID=39947 RepID=UPI0000F18A1A
MSAPVASQSAEMAFTDDTLCAKNAFTASLDSSADQRLVVTIRSTGTHCAYMSFNACTAAVSRPPMRTQVSDGRDLRQELRVGEHLELDDMGVVREDLLDGLGRPDGTVDFSTTTLPERDASTIILAALSQ